MNEDLSCLEVHPKTGLEPVLNPEDQVRKDNLARFLARGEEIFQMLPEGALDNKRLEKLLKDLNFYQWDILSIYIFNKKKGREMGDIEKNIGEKNISLGYLQEYLYLVLGIHAELLEEAPGKTSVNLGLYHQIRDDRAFIRYYFGTESYESIGKDEDLGGSRVDNIIRMMRFKIVNLLNSDESRAPRGFEGEDDSIWFLPRNLPKELRRQAVRNQALDRGTKIVLVIEGKKEEVPVWKFIAQPGLYDSKIEIKSDPEGEKVLFLNIPERYH